MTHSAILRQMPRCLQERSDSSSCLIIELQTIYYVVDLSLTQDLRKTSLVNNLFLTISVRQAGVAATALLDRHASGDRNVKI